MKSYGEVTALLRVLKMLFLFVCLAIIDKRVFLFQEDYEKYKKVKKCPDSEFTMAYEPQASESLKKNKVNEPHYFCCVCFEQYFSKFDVDENY